MRVLGGLVSFYLSRADTVVAIGERMRERLIAKGAPAGARDRDPELGRHDRDHAAAARQRVGARSTGSDGRFVVMHSGNVGHAQNLDALIVATTHLRDLERAHRCR